MQLRSFKENYESSLESFVASHEELDGNCEQSFELVQESSASQRDR